MAALRTQNAELDKKLGMAYTELGKVQSLASTQAATITSHQEEFEAMKKQLAALVVAMGALAPVAAPAADLPVHPRPYVSAPAPRPVERCGYVEMHLANWSGPVTFRVTAVGGAVPTGRIEIPVTLQAGQTRLCIPRGLFSAEKIQICIGQSSIDNSNSRIIQGRWMQIARANLERGNVANPGEPMEFRYNGPTRRVMHGYPHHGRYFGPRRRPLISSSALSMGAAVVSGVLIGRSMH